MEDLNQMSGSDLYQEGHLMVAAIRVLTHRDGTPPAVESASELVHLAREQGYRICNKLNELGIIRILEGPFGTKLDILEHALLEDIPDMAPDIIDPSSVFNPGAVAVSGATHLLLRVQTRGRHTFTVPATGDGLSFMVADRPTEFSG